MYNDDWDDIMDREDNPYNDPDETFSDTHSAYKAGYELGMDDAKDGDIVDLEQEIQYPGMAEDEAIEAFKEGYNDAVDEYCEEMYGDDDTDIDSE